MNSNSTAGGYQIEVKTTWFRFELSQLRQLIVEWDREIGCQVEENQQEILLTFGTSPEIQLLLKGRKKRKFVDFYSGQVFGTTMDEEMLADFLDWLCNVQSRASDMIGLLVRKEGDDTRPLFIKNGQLYDEARMIELLWDHFSTSRIRESKRFEDMYHFFRDVPKYSRNKHTVK
ncbi:hypothetical protein [Effusibacillus dendaii]|uniref:Uncharacterized protein n=1 Tax=Effusibacillus dendaii TaxID=2743772 RepID=A0A7I8DA83_9BACL|nr:hypothetical protein [Effusibacillus dendaii]BCJ87024.1 hypothetical protein skT53_20090 [Effusibacillus dendaii]